MHNKLLFNNNTLFLSIDITRDDISPANVKERIRRVSNYLSANHIIIFIHGMTVHN